MGVMECSRNNCENIMCDRYSPIYGYICYECFAELRENSIRVDIETFMKSPKEPEMDQEMEKIKELYFKRIFPSSYKIDDE